MATASQNSRITRLGGGAPALNNVCMNAKRRPLSREKKYDPRYPRKGVYVFDAKHWLVGWGYTQIALIWHEGGWRLKDTQRAALGEMHALLGELHLQFCNGSMMECPALVDADEDLKASRDAEDQPSKSWYVDLIREMDRLK